MTSSIEDFLLGSIASSSIMIVSGGEKIASKYRLNVDPPLPLGTGAQSYLWDASSPEPMVLRLPLPFSTYLKKGSPSHSFSALVGSFLIVCVLTMACLLLVLRNMDSMKTIPLSVWLPMCLGMVLLSSWMLLFLGVATPSKCYARQWLRGFGVQLVIAPMIALVLHNRTARELPTRYVTSAPSDGSVASWTVAAVGIETILLIIQSGGGAVGPYRAQCAFVQPASGFFFVLLVLFEAATVFVLLVLAHDADFAPSPKRIVHRVFVFSIEAAVITCAVLLVLLLRYSGAIYLSLE